MIKKVIVLSAVLGGLSFFSGGDALAQTCVFDAGTGTGNFVLNCESNTMGSPAFSFDPSALQDAVENTDPAMGPCFTCPNGGAADGSTAGALTNNMFGEILDNDDADLGDQSFRADDNNPNIPDTGSNDSGDFTFTFAIPGQNFLSPGLSAPISTTPDAGEDVELGGVKMEFPENTFTFVADGGSSFSQTIEQVTFTGGLGGDELQIVSFHADSSSDIPDLSTGQGNSQDVNWSQSITEGGFDLGLTNGTFEYGEFGVGPADAPTGASQSIGDDDATIGGF